MKPILEGPVPDSFLEDVDFKCKIVLEPNPNYFIHQLPKDKVEFTKILLIHGLEPPYINSISSYVIEYHKLFDKILSFDEKVLKLCPNSELFCFGSCWILTNDKGELVQLKKDYYDFYKTKKKEFKVSFIKSNKNQLEGHRLRSYVPEMLKNKTFKPLMPTNKIDTKIPLFTDSMFHVTIENSRVRNYFTEKIIDCFMSRTIPIYWGCPNIGDYFDMDGIICFETIDELNNILSNLTEDDYFKRLSNIEINYNKAKEFAFFFDKVNEEIRKL